VGLKCINWLHCDQLRPHNLNIFELFKNLKIFKRNKKSFELKVLATIDYIFSGSYRKISKKLSIIFEPISKSTIFDCVRAFSTRMAIALEPERRDLIAVDETCLKIQGKNVWLWTAIDVVTKELIGYHTSLSRTGLECLIFMRKVLKMCLNKPLVLADGGPWYNWVFDHLGLNKQRMTFGMRSHIENIFKLVKDRTKIFSNNFGTNKGMNRGLVCVEYFMKLFVFWYYFLGGGYV